MVSYNDSNVRRLSKNQSKYPVKREWGAVARARQDRQLHCHKNGTVLPPIADGYYNERSHTAHGFIK